MARTNDYNLLKKNKNILNCPEEYIYICDIQGFQRFGVHNFIFKEISFISLRKTGIPTAYLFKPPIPWYELTDEEKCTTYWLEKEHHGIDWNSGDIPYYKLYTVLKICLQGVKQLIVKGAQKVQWISNLFPHISIINIEDFECCSLDKMQTNNIQYICHNHVLCNRRKPVCAVQNVVSIRDWLLNYLDEDSN